MNLKKILAVSAISLSMVAGVGAAIGVSAGADLKEAEVKAAGETFYLVGVTHGMSWPGDGETPSANEWAVTEGAAPTKLTFKNGDKFKLAKAGTWNGNLGYSNLAGSARSLFGDDGGNFEYKGAVDGTFDVSISGTTVYFDYPDGTEFYYVGSDTEKVADDWTNYTAKPIALNGGATNFVFKLNEEFKIRPVYDAESWAGTLAFGNIDGNFKESEGNYYAYYRCFYGTGDSSNIQVKYAAPNGYDVSVRSVDHNLSVNIVAKNAGTETVYVLDLNGDLLSTTHKAHYWNGTQQTENPGLDMSLLDGTTNIYEATYWDIFTKANFNNGTTYTVDETLTGNEGKCLVLGWAFEGGHWTSNTWVDLDAAKFIDKYMKFETKHENNEGSGDCITSGWYDAAKKAYEAAGFAEHRAEVCKSALVVARLQKWAIANGKTFDVTDGVGAFSAARVTVSPLDSNNNTNFVLIASIAAGTIITVVGATFLLRRRKEDR